MFVSKWVKHHNHYYYYNKKGTLHILRREWFRKLITSLFSVYTVYNLLWFNKLGRLQLLRVHRLDFWVYNFLLCYITTKLQHFGWFWNRCLELRCLDNLQFVAQFRTCDLKRNNVGWRCSSIVCDHTAIFSTVINIHITGYQLSTNCQLGLKQIHFEITKSQFNHHQTITKFAIF